MEMQDKAKAAGIKGEENVAFHLNFFVGLGYAVLHDFKLQAKEQPHMTAQIDHLVIGPNGITHIETKSWKGTFRWENGGTVFKKVSFSNQDGEITDTNPYTQITRHQATINYLLESQKIDVPIHSLIAFDENKIEEIKNGRKVKKALTEVQGTINNSHVTWVYTESVAPTIQSFKAKETLSRDQIVDLAKVIEESIIEKGEHFNILLPIPDREKVRTLQAQQKKPVRMRFVKYAVLVVVFLGLICGNGMHNLYTNKTFWGEVNPESNKQVTAPAVSTTSTSGNKQSQISKEATTASQPTQQIQSTQPTQQPGWSVDKGKLMNALATINVNSDPQSLYNQVNQAIGTWYSFSTTSQGMEELPYDVRTNIDFLYNDNENGLGTALSNGHFTNETASAVIHSIKKLNDSISNSN